MATIYINSPLGPIELTATEAALTSVHFVEAQKVISPKRTETEPNAILIETAAQLDAFFEGKLQVFDLPLFAEGTPFQQRVWTELLEITYGKTASYLEMAIRLGDEKCIRAAATANGRNPIAIIIPCHRVIGSNGSLVGYGGDLWRKKWLLQHEMQYVPQKKDTLF